MSGTMGMTVSKYDQWLTSAPEPCYTCEENGYESCD